PIAALFPYTTLFRSHLGRVDGVDVEVYHHRAVAVLHPVQRQSGGDTHSELAGGRGRQGEPQLAERPPLAGVELPEADERNVSGLDGRGRAESGHDRLRAPSEGEGERHAVEVSRR